MGVADDTEYAVGKRSRTGGTRSLNSAKCSDFHGIVSVSSFIGYHFNHIMVKLRIYVLIILFTCNVEHRRTYRFHLDTCSTVKRMRRSMKVTAGVATSYNVYYHVFVISISICRRCKKLNKTNYLFPFLKKTFL